MKKFIAGVMVGILIMTGTTVFAAGTKKTIEAVFGSVNVVVNGKKLDKETLLYNGTTYLPLRDTAEVVGMEVGWDEKTNTASLSDKGKADVTSNNDNQFYPKSHNVPNFLYLVGMPNDSEIKFEYNDGSGARYRYKLEYVTNSDIALYQRELEKNGYVSDGSGNEKTIFYVNGENRVMVSIEDNIYFQISFNY